MDEGRKVKAEEIEGLREMISSVIREERAVFLPAPLVQDVEELRRSPAGAIIRLEGKVDHLAERFTDLEETLDQIAARMVTRDELTARLRPLATKDDLARTATRDELQAGLARMATKEELARMATKEDLQAGLSRVVTKEDLDIRLEGLEKQISILRITFFAVVTLIVGLQTAILIKLLFP